LTTYPADSYKSYEPTGALNIVKHVLTPITYLELTYLNYFLFDTDPTAVPVYDLYCGGSRELLKYDLSLIEGSEALDEIMDWGEDTLLAD
jgi:hypothetical protein